MRTKEQIIYSIRDQLKALDQTSQFDPRTIEMNCNHVWEQMLADMSGKGMTYLDFYCKEYNSVQVLNDITRNLYYSVLPAPICQLNDYSEGVRSISTMQGLDLDFIPMSEEGVRMMNGLEVDQIDTNIPYIVRWDRIYYYDNITPDIVATGVRMALVVPFTEFEMTDQFPMPEGKAMDFVMAVVKYMASSQPADLNNKNEN